jgi:hypothetical protein
MLCNIGVSPHKQCFCEEPDISKSTFVGSAPRDDSSDDDGSGDDEERPQKKKAPKKRKKAEKGEGGSAPNGFTKAFPVSEKMAAWLGKSEISRPELTSFFWKYIKDNGLQVRPWGILGQYCLAMGKGRSYFINLGTPTQQRSVLRACSI